MKDLDFIDNLLPEINERVKKMKNEMLMDEPCSLYEPGWEDVSNNPADWADFWENEDK